MPTISSRNGIRRRAPPTSAVSGLAAPVAVPAVVRRTGPAGGAVLGGAALGAALGGAVFCGAALEGAVLGRAVLAGAVLAGAVLGDAVLGGAAVLALGGASGPGAGTAFSTGRPGEVTVRAGGRADCDRVSRAGEVPRGGTACRGTGRGGTGPGGTGPGGTGTRGAGTRGAGRAGRGLARGSRSPRVRGGAEPVTRVAMSSAPSSPSRRLPDSFRGAQPR
ncbi:MAG: pentapeptide repeat-containing protein [Streptosporangiaceae bacterium]